MVEDLPSRGRGLIELPQPGDDGGTFVGNHGGSLQVLRCAGSIERRNRLSRRGARGCPGEISCCRLPSNGESLPRGSAVTQVEVYQGLIWNSRFFGQLLEVLDGLVVEANRDLALQPSSVGISTPLREVVLLPHLDHLWL